MIVKIIIIINYKCKNDKRYLKISVLFAVILLIPSLIRAEYKPPKDSWKVKTGEIALDTNMDENGNVVCGLGTYEPAVGGICFYNAKGKTLWKKGLRYNINSVSITQDGKKIVAGGWSGFIYSFDSNGKMIWNHKLKKIVFGVAYDKYGKYLEGG